MADRNDYPEACTGCGKSTYEACDRCKKWYDSGCLFHTQKILALPSDLRNEDDAEQPTEKRDEEFCLTCYVEVKGHAPVMLWQESQAEAQISPVPMIEFGYVFYAESIHSWYSPPLAGNLLSLRWGDQHIELDTFRTLQLLKFLQANEQLIHEQAKATSAVLVPQDRKMTERVMNADGGRTR